MDLLEHFVGGSMPLLPDLLGELKANQFLFGGLVLLFVGAAGALLRRIPGQLVAAVRRRIIVEAQVTSDDEALRWLLIWLSKSEWAHKARSWRIITGGSQSNEERPVGGPSRTRALPPISFVPCPGIHVSRYKGRWLWFWYSREAQAIGTTLLGFHERLWLFTFGTDKSVFTSLIEEAHRACLPEDEARIGFYIQLWGSWGLQQWLLPRPLDSVVFEDALGQVLVDDILQFEAQRDWYRRMGIPWRRGYLLHGPPGNGKTSVVVAVAGALGRSIYSLSPGRGLGDSRLRELLLSVPEGAVVLIEDIDGALSTEEGGEEHTTRSGLLNALDGVGSREGRIVFMTTNRDLSGLDPALLRPGRADRCFHVASASPLQLEELFRRFHPGSDGLAAEFAKAMPAGGSMAQAQGVLLQHLEDPSAAVRAVSGPRASVGEV